MKTPMVLLSIGLLSSGLAGTTGYLAWNSLSHAPNAKPVVATAQSQPSLISPIPSVGAPVAAPAQIHSSQSNLIQTNPAQPSALVRPAASQTAWSQPENDYLFDLSQALQPSEYQRLSSSQQLEIARQIQSWLTAGANFWSLRQQFDRTYGQAVVGDYAHNREVYIRFAAERFTPGYLDSLIAPAPFSGPFADRYSVPYAAPHLVPEGIPEGVMPDAYNQPPFLPPYPDAYGYAPPEAYGIPDFYSGPNSGPYSGPNSGPNYPNRAPDFAPNPYPNPYQQPMQPAPQPPQAPQPYSPPSPQSPIPNVTEVST